MSSPRKPMTKVVSASKPSVWKNLALGGSSCAIATTFTHPIDTIKLRLQLQGVYSTPNTRYSGLCSGLLRVTQEEGLRALYFGISPAILRAATYSASRIGFYEPIRTALTVQTNSEQPTFGVKIASAILSGATGAVVGNPCELIKVRMQRRNAAAYRHVFHAIFHIVRNDGIAALWTGTMPAAVRASLLTSSQLATYDQGKALIKHCTGLHEGLSAHVGAAMTAGLVTTTVSTPADVVKSVVMSSNPRLRPVECINLILTRDGLSGFLRGWTANYARLGPHTLITVVAYENLRTACGWKNL